jgi:hypothetical protein
MSGPLTGSSATTRSGLIDSERAKLLRWRCPGRLVGVAAVVLPLETDVLEEFARAAGAARVPPGRLERV